jgi:hypothetical protein
MTHRKLQKLSHFFYLIRINTFFVIIFTLVNYSYFLSLSFIVTQIYFYFIHIKKLWILINLYEEENFKFMEIFLVNGKEISLFTLSNGRSDTSWIGNYSTREWFIKLFTIFFPHTIEITSWVAARLQILILDRVNLNFDVQRNCWVRDKITKHGKTFNDTFHSRHKISFSSRLHNFTIKFPEKACSAA